MEDIAAANRRYFDAISDQYDSKPFFQVVNQQVTEHIQNDIAWLGIPFQNPENQDSILTATGDVRMLDYACGTGLITRAFRPYVTETKGLDISPNMVASYNARARTAGIPESAIHASTGNLLDKANPSPEEFSGKEWNNFDLATVGFGFHHFEDVVFAAAQLKERLRPGGVLLITDFLEGADMLADEEGKPIEESQGNHAVHSHGHHHHKHEPGQESEVEHGHGHGHGHHQEHKHGHGYDDSNNKKHAIDDTSPEFKKKMNASIVVPHFTIQGVKEFFAEAGFVDVDVRLMKEKSYMEFAGKKLWRTVLFAKGRRPEEKREKSEL